jgi:hypothetical protein
MLTYAETLFAWACARVGWSRRLALIKNKWRFVNASTPCVTIVEALAKRTEIPK